MESIKTSEVQKVNYYTNDEFAKFMFSQIEKIKNYHFDLCHDISSIVKFAYNDKNYRDTHGQLITNTAVEKKYFFYVREFGSYLFDVDADINNTIETNHSYINKYEITITLNSSYLFGVKFAKVVTIK